MSSVKITSVETENAQGKNVDLFNPFTDSLKLTMFFTLSPDILAMPNVVLAGTFEIIELRTNQVAVYHVAQANYNPALGPYVFWWLGSPTPHDWGLQWTAGDIFGFRAAVEVSAWQGEQGLVPVDAFDVSGVRWFRLEDVGEL